MRHLLKVLCLLLAAVLLSAFASCGTVPAPGEPGFVPTSSNAESSAPSETSPQSGQESLPTSESRGETPAESSGTTSAADPGETSVPSGSVPEYKVSRADWANVEWEQYSNVYFTLTIPKGWKVNWKGNAQQLFWSVSRPDGTLGISNLDHYYAAKSYAWMQAGGADMFLANGTVREFFETYYSQSTESFEVQNSVVPENYTIIQSSNPNKKIRDYQSMYVHYRENGEDGEGVYSAILVDSPDVYVGGYNYGMWEIDGIVTAWSKRGEFVNWSPVLTQIGQSFRYTDYYVQEWKSVLGTNVGIDTSSSSVDTGSVLEAFEERSTQDTILQEKRSDMLEEYERVVDNKTGEIYRAYSGFMDDIGNEQTRYTPITDSQYADGFVGWIDK